MPKNVPKIHEKSPFWGTTKSRKNVPPLNVGHEAAKVSEKFSLVHKVMNMDPIKGRDNENFKDPSLVWTIPFFHVPQSSGREKHYGGQILGILSTFWKGWSDALLDKPHQKTIK